MSIVDGLLSLDNCMIGPVSVKESWKNMGQVVQYLITLKIQQIVTRQESAHLT